MKTNPARTIILIQNPLCGNQTIIKALGLTESPCPEFSTPREARESISADEWKAAKKIVLARSVESRFESAATYAVNNAEKFDGPVKDFLLSVRDIKGASQHGKAILQWLVNIPDLERPLIFRQQKNWLASKFDLVLCTDDIAPYFNGQKNKGSVQKLNIITRNPKFDHVALPHGSDRKLLEAAFPDDVSLLKRVLVWNPQPDTIRLVTGICTACAKKRKGGEGGESESSEGSSFEPLDLISVDESFSEAPAPASVRKSKKTPQ